MDPATEAQEQAEMPGPNVTAWHQSWQAHWGPPSSASTPFERGRYPPTTNSCCWSSLSEAPARCPAS